MSEALSMHANEAYDELTEEQKHICEVMFKGITEKRGENFGIRRPTRLNELAAIAANDPYARVLICGSLYLAGSVLRENG